MQELANMEFMDAADFKKNVMHMLEKTCPAAFEADVEDNEIEMEVDARKEETDDPKDDDKSYQPEKNDSDKDASKAEE